MYVVAVVVLCMQYVDWFDSVSVALVYEWRVSDICCYFKSYENYFVWRPYWLVEPKIHLQYFFFLHRLGSWMMLPVCWVVGFLSLLHWSHCGREQLVLLALRSTVPYNYDSSSSVSTKPQQQVLLLYVRWGIRESHRQSVHSRVCFWRLHCAALFQTRNTEEHKTKKDTVRNLRRTKHPTVLRSIL